ncbi:hypothetical protein BDN72DRAFT_893031 [Pluteus cervinus]|uniref:Uncharacterized protein n=1 Tax=Pluteus cervinus TaxID=181527 RepID=A0ACD3B8P6_9AGAR|nr:hypothetical protein BDN72DRAFT_893031 [Pluteus cervinus]
MTEVNRIGQETRLDCQPAEQASVSPPIHHNPFYYFSPIILQVGNHLFKVPRYQLEAESEYFRDLFTVRDHDKVGSEAEEQPLRLYGLEGDAFRQLLRVLYPCDFQNKESLSLLQWTQVLFLSDVYQFQRVRALAVSYLDGLLEDPIGRIRLGRVFSIDTWQLSGLDNLVCREEPLSLAGADYLGMETVLRLANLRERCVQRRPEPIPKPSPPKPSPNFGRWGQPAYSNSFQSHRPVTVHGQTAGVSDHASVNSTSQEYTQWILERKRGKAALDIKAVLEKEFHLK